MIGDLVKKGLEYFGRYYGSYRGYVINNVDPKNIMRLEVFVPSVMIKGESRWAYAKGIIAGDDRLFKVIPAKGDLVWVEFENGSKRLPIWNYGYPVSGEIPEDQITKDSWFYKTPYGHTVEFEPERINITFFEGTSITLTKESITLNNTDNGGLLIKQNVQDQLNSITNSMAQLKTLCEQSFALCSNVALSGPAVPAPLQGWLEPQIEITSNDSVLH